MGCGQGRLSFKTRAPGRIAAYTGIVARTVGPARDRWRRHGCKHLQFHDTPFVPVATDAASSVTDDALLLKVGPVDEEDNVGTRILQTMAGLNARLDTALAPPAIEVKVPNVVAAARATHWTDHALPKKDAKRHQCPISIYREPRSLADFEGHLRACRLKQVAANDNLAAVRRFFEVISINDLDELPDESWQVGVLLGVYQERVLDTLYGAQLFDLKYSWSRRIVTGLDHWCTACMHECTRRRWKEAKDSAVPRARHDRTDQEAIVWCVQRSFDSEKKRRRIAHQRPSFP